MFGHQDDTQESQINNQDNQSAPVAPATQIGGTGYLSAHDLSQPAASSPPLLEEQAADGYVATPITPPATAQSSDSDDHAAPNNDANSLLDIKQHALQQLSPLVGHLEQTPEEKFRTTMMMIQASDDQSLISTAYEAANGITDEKSKAQALLDIVNEINYFTQH